MLQISWQEAFDRCTNDPLAQKYSACDEHQRAARSTQDAMCHLHRLNMILLPLKKQLFAILAFLLYTCRSPPMQSASNQSAQPPYTFRQKAAPPLLQSLKSLPQRAKHCCRLFRQYNSKIISSKAAELPLVA